MIENGDAIDEVSTRLAQRRKELAECEAGIDELMRTATWSQNEPSRAWIVVQLRNLDAILRSPTPAACQALRRLVGGSIVVEQVQDSGKSRGFLRGRFSLDVPAALEIAGILPQTPQIKQHLSGSTMPSREIVIDFIAPPSHSELSDRAWELYQSGKRIKQIAAELKIDRNSLKKLLRATAAQRGQQLIDGRARNGKIRQATGQPRRHVAIADDVMELYAQGILQDDIALRLGVGRDLVSRAIRYWHESRRLPVPDGRTRRKSLNVKSNRERAPLGSDAKD